MIPFSGRGTLPVCSHPQCWRMRWMGLIPGAFPSGEGGSGERAVKRLSCLSGAGRRGAPDRELD